MDIWAWIRDTRRTLHEDGHQRLAELIDRVPSAACNDRHGTVEALVPEALAEVRRIDHPWLELFFRHWLLQSRVLHRFECADNLNAAVELVEFAHRPETRDCPQSRCVHQNLACAYGYIDGPGYAADRLQVADEALERIDARWPCYVCIASERTNALVHADRLEEALAYTDELVAARKDVGQYSADEFAPERIEVLLALGRATDALEELDKAEPWAPSDNRRTGFAIDRARILVALGRAEEGVEHLPEFAAIDGTRVHYEPWIEALVGMVDAGVVANTWQLEGQLARMTQDLVAHGILRISVDTLLTRGRLALDRESTATARWCLDQACALLDGLRARDEPRAGIESLRADIKVAEDIANADEAALADDPDEALAALSGGNPEVDLELLTRMLERWPHHVSVVEGYVSALDALGRADTATAYVERVVAEVDGSTDHRDLRLLLGHRYVSAEQPERAAALGREMLDHPERFGDTALVDGHWLVARASLVADDSSTGIEHLRELLAIDPALSNARILLADALRDTRALPEALDAYAELLRAREDADAEGDRAPIIWSMLPVATELERWDLVRELGRELGMTFQNDEGPVDETWGMVLVRFDEADEPEEHVAVRTGPVTATVVRVAGPGVTQHYKDRVIFDAAPARIPEAEDGLYVFPVERVLESGGWQAIPMMGNDPGSPCLTELEQWLEAESCELHLFLRGEDDPEGENRFAALVAFPANVETAAVETLVAGWLETHEVDAEFGLD